MKKTIILILTLFTVMLLPYFIMLPGINTQQERVRLEAEYTHCLREYSTLSRENREEFLLKSYDIYADLCSVLTATYKDMHYESISVKVDDLMRDIYRDQITAVQSEPDVFQQSIYIKDILSRELYLLHEAGNVHQAEMVKDMKKLYNIK